MNNGPAGLDKSVIRSSTEESAWVGTHENIFVLGPTGVGKASLLVFWHRRRAAMVIQHFTLGGTSKSAIPRWPTASATDWCIMRIALRCAEIQCVRIVGRRADNPR